MKYLYNFEGYVLKYINILYFKLLILFKMLYICILGEYITKLESICQRI